MADKVFDGSKTSFHVVGSEDSPAEDNWLFAIDVLTGMGGHVTPVFMLHLEESTVLTRVEVYQERTNDAWAPTHMIVQAEDEDGNWITVAEYENYGWAPCASIEFDFAVETMNIRVLATVMNRSVWF